MLQAKLRNDYLDQHLSDKNKLVTIPAGSVLQINWTGAEQTIPGIIPQICECEYQGLVAYINFEDLELLGLPQV